MVATYTSVNLIHHKYTLYHARVKCMIIRYLSSQHMKQGHERDAAVTDMKENDMAPNWDMGSSVRFAAPLISLST
jgi:hypothetical protein